MPANENENVLEELEDEEFKIITPNIVKSNSMNNFCKETIINFKDQSTMNEFDNFNMSEIQSKVNYLMGSVDQLKAKSESTNSNHNNLKIIKKFIVSLQK